MKNARGLWKKVREAVSDKIGDLGLLVEDAYCELRLRREKEKKHQKKLQQELSAEEFQAYLKKRRIKQLQKSGIAFLGAVLVVLLLIGLVKAVGGALLHNSQNAQTETETETESETEVTYPVRDITLGSTGCMLLHSPFIDSYPDAEGNYDFSSIYRFIEPYYSAPDFMTCEFEGALGGDELGYSGYPSFRSPDVIIENIRDSGVDLQLLATNHIYDGWSYAFTRTMDVYEEKGIAYTGVRKSAQDKHYYIADIDGVRVGFVNYVYETTYATDGQKSLNGMILESQDAPLVNSFDPENTAPFYAEMENNIYNMRQDGARFIVANLHWGIEYQLEESESQREIAQALCDMGVDAVIGGHPHCEQPIDVLTSKNGEHQMFCIYSEGNALSNQRTYLLMEEMPTGHTEDGAMVTLHLHQSPDGTVSITDVELLPTWVYRYSDDSGSKYYILPLDDVDTLEQKTGISGIYEEAKASYDRTMEELGPGLQKAKAAFHAANNS